MPEPTTRPDDTLVVSDVASLLADPAWDLATDSLYSRAAWLASVEDFSGEPAEVVQVRRHGELVCGITLYPQREPGNAFYRVGDVLSGLGLPLDDPPSRLVGTRSGYESVLVGAPDAAAVALLREHVVSTGPASAMYVPDAELVRCRSAGLVCGTPVPVNASAHLPLPFTSFDDYLSSLSRGRRSVVRRERRTFASSGLVHRREDLSACVEECGPLLAMTQQKHGHPTSPEGATRLLWHQAERVGSSSLVHTARRDGRLVGFALTYDVGGWTWVRLVGLDADGLADAFEYFNLAVYEPVLAAIERGSRGVRLGMESLRAKVLRGAQVEPLWLVPVGWSPGEPGTLRDVARRYVRSVADQVGLAAATDHLAALVEARMAPPAAVPSADGAVTPEA